MFLNKSSSRNRCFGVHFKRRFMMDTIVTAEFFDSVWKILASTTKRNVREFDAIHLQFNFRRMFEFNKCVGEFWFLLQGFDKRGGHEFMYNYHSVAITLKWLLYRSRYVQVDQFKRSSRLSRWNGMYHFFAFTTKHWKHWCWSMSSR